MSEQLLHRTLHPEIRILDQREGLAEYVASDETLDSFGEVIMAKGWRFDRFKKNAPFVDSHQYDSVQRQLGRVVDFEVKGGRLIETVKWAIDVPENQLAQLGWKMTVAGYLKGVSVGFYPEKMLHPDDDDWGKTIEGLGMDPAKPEKHPRRIYTRQQQVELSAVLIPANPSALLKAYTEKVISEEDATIVLQRSRLWDTDLSTSGDMAPRPKTGHAEEPPGQRRLLFALQLRQLIG